MARSITALLASIFIHIVVIAGLAMPQRVSSHSERIFIHIKAPEITQPEPVDEIIEPEPTPVTNTEPEVLPESPPVQEIPDPETATGMGDDVPPRDTSVGEINAGTGDVPEGTQGEGDAGPGGNEVATPAGNSEGEETDPTGIETTLSPDLDAIREAYKRRVLSEIESTRVYPQMARRLGREGTVTVRFTVASDGSVSNLSIVESSGTDSLDDAARDAVISSSPLPPIPEELETGSLILSLEIVYTLD